MVSLKYKEIKTSTEIAGLFKLVNEIWREVFTPILGAEQVEYMLTHYQGPEIIAADIARGMHYFSLENRGIPVGYLAYSLETDHLFISKIYLKKDCRGLGLASQVFAHFTEIARQNNKPKLFLHVNRFNKQAVAVYLHYGFKIIQTVDEPLGEKFFLNDYWMEKNLITM